MPSIDVLLFRFFLVIIVGGLIGAEREYRSKSAGFRTMILICLGSFLYTTFSYYSGSNTSDRIASNIVTGIGFIGAGVIFRSDKKVNGLTTAASIWVVAALGMGIAIGLYIVILVAIVIALASLFLFTYLERWIDHLNQSHNYKIVSNYKPELLDQYEKIFEDCNLSFKRLKQTKTGSKIIGTWVVQGKEDNHKIFIEKILRDATVEEFEF